MPPVLDGQAVNQTVTNAAFLDAVDNDTAIGIITLNNSDVSSGTSVTNLQKEHNSAASFMGKSLNAAKDVLPVFSSDEGFAALQSLYARVNALSDKFKLSGGHAHSGGAGDGAVLDFLDLSNTQLIGYAVLATQLTGVTGSSTTVTTEMTGKTNSTGTTVKGVVVINPYNYIPMFNANNDSYLDGSGNKVYGRLTYSAGVWTLTYYSNVSGTETAYSFSGSNTVNWFYQELFDESDRPVYSDIFLVQSDQIAGEVPSATTSVKGKTQLATTVTDVASTSSAGTANATVANADHSHQGVHSVKKSGDTALYGDVTFTGTGATVLTQVGNNIQISSTAGTGTVTDVSVVNANGFNGSVATSTTTPAITISTTVTGLLNGNGTSVAAATGSQVNTVVGSADLVLSNALSIAETTDTSTGNIDALSTTNISNIRLTGAAPVLRGIASGSNGKLLLITNRSGVSVTVSNQHATPTAANRIITGTGADLTLESNAAIFLKYDSTTARWQIVGGSGSGSGTGFDPWTSITLSGMGTGISQSIFARKEGSDLHIKGAFDCTTVNNSTGRFTLTGYTIDSSKISTKATPYMGIWHVAQGGSTQINASAQSGHVFYDGSDTAALYIATHVASNSYTKINNWQTIMGSSNTEVMHIDFLVPVV